MKEIKAIIQPHMLSKVLDALHNCEHFPGITISDCQGQSRGRGPGGQYQATPETIFLAKKVKLELFCTDDVCDHVVKVIQNAAHTGRPGDGILVVRELVRVLKLRTAEENDKAL
jgi:nitrogen regulatory protein P-II 1